MEENQMPLSEKKWNAFSQKLIDNTLIKEPGRHRDGDDNRGLYLQITENGASWLLRYDVECAPRMTNPKREGELPRKTTRRERWLGLGSLKDFSLKEARARARAKRQLLADGIDPLAAREEERLAEKVAAAKAITFEQAARQYFEEKKAGWRSAKHRDQFINTLEQFAFPVIGSLPIETIDKGLVLKVLEQPYTKGKSEGRLWSVVPETANRLRGRIERVLDWDAVRNDRKAFLNPARWDGHLEHVLTARSKIPDKKIKHHPALSYNDIGDFFTELRERNEPEAAALEFTILTAARSNEVIGAKWEEFELRAEPVTTRDEEGHESTIMGPCWIVPGDRMKGFKRHRIPLSERAVEILERLRKDTDAHTHATGLVFDGLSDMDMWILLKKLRNVTVHGFRSTFRDWAGDVARHPPEAAEKALAHGIKDKSEASYWRSDMFDKRKLLMRDWARFCDAPKRDATVTDISKARVSARKSGKRGV
jgi:integrase